MFVTYSHSLPVATFPSDQVWLKTRRYSRVVGQTLLFALTSIFFVGLLYKDFPKGITKTVLVLLSGVGTISLPYMLDYIKKIFVDGTQSLRLEEYFLAALAFIHIAEISSNTSMTILSLAASIFGWCRQEAIQSKIYQNMIFWGELTIVVGVAIALLECAINYFLLQKIDRDRKEEIGLALENLAECPEITPDVKSALALRFCMDKDTLEECLKELRRSNEKSELIAIAIENLETQLNVNLGGQLLLTLLGYMCLALEKYFTPNSPITAGINFTMSLSWTVKIYIETIKEMRQRSRMNELALI